MEGSQTPFVHDGVRYGMARWGAPDAAPATPLILLHGFSQSAASWDDVAVQLGATRPVYALDLVGHGASDRPDNPEAYALDAQGAALCAFAHHVAAVENAHPAVLGYSMGGRVTLSALSGDPHAFSAVILEAAGLGPASPADRAAAAERDARCAARLRVDGLAAFMDVWEQLPLFATQRTLPADVRERLHAARMANDAEALARTFEHAGQHVMPDRAANLATLAALASSHAQPLPLLYLAGEHDQKYRAQAHDFAAATHAATCIVPGAGHNTHLEAPAAFVREVEAFLSAR
ncbi:alpha/beta fold hydrolase [Eggerthella sinensis]|uniref:alpha/beta fold hydrolase n=1 Tax=Eggerthella sinensis TaxID=242230 RepID=UPI001D094C3C|nr:alpha/beta fold hydrolase [Eggerthella sinensis]MCB7036576.1 alpha/beta fold hydrolase [Eggerthella sinensis]